MSDNKNKWLPPLDYLSHIYVAVLVGVWIGVFISNIHDPLGTLLFYRAALVGFLIFTPSMFLFGMVVLLVDKIFGLSHEHKLWAAFGHFCTFVGQLGAVCLGCLLAFGLIESIIRTTISFIAGLF